MKRRLLHWLRCPHCNGDLGLRVQREEEGEILDGDLSCRSCGRNFPILRGIPRFVDADGYARSFSFEWTVNRRTQLDTASSHESESMFGLTTPSPTPALPRHPAPAP